MEEEATEKHLMRLPFPFLSPMSILEEEEERRRRRRRRSVTNGVRGKEEEEEPFSHKKGKIYLKWRGKIGRRAAHKQSG